jgi:hypothetical protein
MSTSLYQGLVRSEAAQWDAYSPGDAAWCRAILSNVMHSADSCGQVLVNYRVADSFAITRSLLEGTTWFAVAQFGALPTRFRGDGTSYRYRIRIRAAVDNGTADFAVCVFGGKLTTSAGFDAIRIGAPRATFGEANTTPAWLTLTTPTLYFGPASVYETEVGRSVLTEIGGAATAVYWDTVKIAVFAKAKTGTLPQSARLSGLHVAEYIGND